MHDRKHMFLITILCLGLVCHLEAQDIAFTKTTYALTNEPIDVVIPCTDKDLLTLNLCIRGIRANGQNIRRIIVVSDKKLTDEAEWFDEKNYPFTKYEIALEIFGGNHEEAQKFISSPRTRVGWIFAQCLKLYAAFVIPNISSNILCLDSDTVFLNPVTFLNKSGGGMYNPGTEYHMPYFQHMQKLLPGLKRLWTQHSGISHHMIFQKPIIDNLFAMIEAYHHTDTWRAICRCIDRNAVYGSAFSEYEIYFNFAFARTQQVSLRFLKWENTGQLNTINSYNKSGFHYISCHSYMR